MISIVYKKGELKNKQSLPVDVNLDYLIEDFSQWVVECIVQPSDLMKEELKT